MVGTGICSVSYFAKRDWVNEPQYCVRQLTAAMRSRSLRDPDFTMTDLGHIIG